MRTDNLSYDGGGREAGRFPSPGLLIFSCLFIYTAMMATKSVYLAEIAYLMEIFSVDKATASMANTYYFLAYAGMQVALFAFIKKLDVRKYVVFTVPLSAVAIILMGFCDTIEGMRILFLVAGLFQAPVYSSANHVLTHYLPAKYLTRANTVMSFGFAFGTVISYGVSAVCVGFGLWRIPFFVSGGLLLVSILLFAVCSFLASESDNVGSVGSATRDEEKPFISLTGRGDTTVFYVFSIAAIFLSGVLYYAVMNWISTLLVEVHSLSQDISIYITTLAPLLISIGPVLTIRSCDRHRNFIRVGLVYFLFALPTPLLLAFLYDASALLAFVLSALFVILMNGVKTMSMTVAAFKMRREVNTAQFCVIANAAGSLSAAIAPTATGKVIDEFGWSVSYLAVFGLAVALVILFVGADLVSKKRQTNL